MDSKQYIFPPFCQIEKMDNPMAEEMLAKENVTSKCALFNSKAKSIFFINESIKNFLELFREPKSFQEFLEVVYADTNEMDEAKNKELFAFFELMIKQGFIVDANTDFDVEAPDIVVENFKNKLKKAFLKSTRLSSNTSRLDRKNENDSAINNGN